MALDTLKKIFYTQPQNHNNAYLQRFHSPSSVVLNFHIKQFNHDKSFLAFFYYSPELVRLLEHTYIRHNELNEIISSFPNIALHQFALASIIDEVHSTSAIEGIHSTKRELKDVIEGNYSSSHFSSIIKKYNLLLDNSSIPFYSCYDIRTFYDDFAHLEISSENPRNKLDGAIFRTEAVDIKSSTGKILHRGITPESKIIDSLNYALDILHDDNMPVLIRIALFHYLFVYIHPFYDGNGRTARFIASYFLAQHFHPLAALRLSVTIRHNIKHYYDILHDTELEINCGDLTPFLYAFIQFFVQTINDISKTLKLKSAQLGAFSQKIDALHLHDEITVSICHILLQASAFFGQGVSMKELMALTGKSRNTIKAKLASIPQELIIVRGNKKLFYKLNPIALKDLQSYT